MSKEKNVFDDDEDDAPEEYIDPKKRMVMQSIEKAKQEEVKKYDDIYEYDAFYDKMKTEKKKLERVQKEKEEKERGQSKYISSLLKTAEERKFLHDQVHDKKILKEIIKRKEIYGETEVFYTKDYEEKLQENKRKLEAIEKKNSIIESNRDKKSVNVVEVAPKLVEKKENAQVIEQSGKFEVVTKIDNVEKEDSSVKSDENVAGKPLWPKPSVEYILAAKERALQRLEARMK